MTDGKAPGMMVSASAHVRISGPELAMGNVPQRTRFLRCIQWMDLVWTHRLLRKPVISCQRRSQRVQRISRLLCKADTCLYHKGKETLPKEVFSSTDWLWLAA